MTKETNTSMTGQALITLLFFVVIAITITTAAVVIILTGNTSTTSMEQGTRAYYVSEAGIENALIRLLRDPSYTGETLTIDDGSSTITVTGSGPYVILSKGTVGNFVKTLQVDAQYTNNILTVTGWKEI